MAGSPRPSVQIALGIALVLVCSTVGLTLVHHERSARAGTVCAPATVIGSVRDGDAYHPLVRFSDAAGRDHTAPAAKGGGQPLYETGTQVAIVYDPEEPRSVRIDSCFGRYGLPLLCGVLGLFAVFGLVLRPLRRLRDPW